MTRDALRDFAASMLACGIGFAVGLCLHVASVGIVRLSLLFYH
jgi:hypothetical protein